MSNLMSGLAETGFCWQKPNNDGNT